MPPIPQQVAEARLTLRGQLADLTLVSPWVEALAAKHGISGETRFAIDLCLEEALSNIVRHGYQGEPGHAIAVTFAVRTGGGLTFTVEDHAPPFAPSEEAELGDAPASIEELQPGGRGIQLMRRFAGSLAWERLPDGNRLTITFPSPPAPVD
jgi:anti-sigma regulatory factor (Ser/Thr protein kinase)